MAAVLITVHHLGGTSVKSGHISEERGRPSVSAESAIGIAARVILSQEVGRIGRVGEKLAAGPAQGGDAGAAGPSPQRRVPGTFEGPPR